MEKLPPMPHVAPHRRGRRSPRAVSATLLLVAITAGACGQPVGRSVAAGAGRPDPAAAVSHDVPVLAAPPTVDAEDAGQTGGVGRLLAAKDNRGGGKGKPESSTPAPPSTTEPGLFSVNVDGLWNYRWTWAAADRDRQFRAIAGAGVGSVRASITWQEIQSCRPGTLFCSGQFEWQRYDEWVGALARAGLTLDVLLGWSATWASSQFGQELAPPANPAEFAVYAKAVATRYGRDGEFWRANPALPYRPVATFEVWNEPNMAHWWRPTPDPGAYAGLYLTTRDAIKNIDPAATVIVGGIAAAPETTWDGRADVEFLREMYERRPDLRGRVDGVGFHPYAPTPADVLQRVAEMRAVLRDVGEPAVPLMLTEIGWPTRGDSDNVVASDDVAAQYVRDALVGLSQSGCGVARITWYTWVAPEQDPSESIDWMGLVNRDASPKPAGTAFVQTTGAITAGQIPVSAPSAC